MSISDALASIPYGTHATVSLLANCTDAAGEIIAGCNVTFALNGYNLIFKPSGYDALSIYSSIVDYTGKGTLQVIGSNYNGLYVNGGSCKLTYAKTSGTTYSAILAVGASVTVNGDVDTGGINVFGIAAEPGANVTVTGNITSPKGEAIWASDKGSKVTVTGNVKGGAGNSDYIYAAVVAKSGAVVNVTGNVTCTAGNGIKATDAGTAVNITGAVTAEMGPYLCSVIDAETGAGVTVAGNISSTTCTGIYALDKGTKVKIAGNIASGGGGGGGGYGVMSQSAACVNVTGSVMATGAFPNGVLAYNGGSLTINGDVTIIPAKDTGGVGVEVSLASTVTVTGNVSVSGKYPDEALAVSAGFMGSTANDGSTVTVGGALVGTILAFNGCVVKAGSVPPGAKGIIGGPDIALTPSNTAHILPGKFPGYTTYVDSKSKPSGYIAVKNPTVTRLFGQNRYSTAVAIAKKGWSASDTVLLAYALNYPDALAGVTLATMKNAPILITDLAATPSVTMSEIKALKAKNIVLLGGVGVISAAQENALKKAGYNVTRYYGTNRFGTAASIGNAVEKLGGSKTAVLTTGMAFPDALAMGPYAGMNKMPLIFTDTKELPSETQTFIKNNKITKIILVNDGNDVSAAVITKVKSLVGSANVTVITATDRYDLSAKVANAYKASFANGVAVATGADFPDALTGGALAAKIRYPVLLVSPTGAAAAETSYVKGLSGPQIYVFGGVGVVPDKVVQSLYK